tara:strand:+ start:299 stop:463 length:165 start_codon:yes stop_codon:yes gene_type:complete
MDLIIAIVQASPHNPVAAFLTGAPLILIAGAIWARMDERATLRRIRARIAAAHN